MSHILLLLDHKTNRTLLSRWLGQHYEVFSQEQGTVPMAPFDLCLIDGPALDRLWKEVRQYKAVEDPAFLPVVLITSNREAELLTRHLWKTVDELIRAPIEKMELQARVEMLLRTRQLSQELKLRNQDLESFFYAMTHDVRAPLRAIKSFTQLLQEEGAWQMGEQGQQDLKHIQSAAEHMQETIDGLIAFARIDRSNRQMQSISLAPLVQACLQKLQWEIQQRQAQVVVDESLPEVQGIPLLLSLALTNLLSNALKFMPSDRHPVITLRATTSPLLCRLEIADNGIGIPLEDQQRLFQPFVQLHGREVYDGIGLGLATVRKTVELMGGRTGVISAIGQGSTFWIELRRGA
jgi:signal transduction histidine kinase